MNNEDSVVDGILITFKTKYFNWKTIENKIYCGFITHEGPLTNENRHFTI